MLQLYYKKINADLGFALAMRKQKIITSWVGPDDRKSSYEHFKKFDETLPEHFADLPQSLETSFVRYVEDGTFDLSRLSHTLPEKISPFAKAVYQQLKKIKAGDLITYDELGRRTGLPYSAQAVGQVVGKNPLPLIIPCHRVVGKNAKGGFSAVGGLRTKEKILNLEGLSLEYQNICTVFDRGFNKEQTLNRFLKVAPQFKKLVQVHPFLQTTANKPLEVFASLSKSVVYQQLSTKAAQTIFKNILKMQGQGNFLQPHWFLKQPPEQLQQCGMSFAKYQTIKALAELQIENGLPNLEQIKSMPSFMLRRQLSEIKGIGPWTVEMYLIFSLGRLDVFSVGDYGLMKGLKRMTGKEQIAPIEALRMANRWSPFKTLGSWYLWRSLEPS